MMFLNKAKLAAGASVTALGLAAVLSATAHGMTMEERMAIAEELVDNHLQPSQLSREEQLEEMRWFIEAAEPYRGMSINTVAESLPTHVWESEILADYFSRMTGVNVEHSIIQEGDLVERLQTEMQSRRPIYDAYINDADSIGTHFRYDATLALEDYMSGEGADITLPTLDLDDFIGLDMARDPDGKLYQLPAQQFANLYWFRYDWFQREDFQEQFREIYGYDLGVPVNWSAYEDIAEFFTEHVGEIDGQRVYGHMDYGRRDPSLGWRFTDAWFSMAGAGDTGLPNGIPVDEWGIRVEDGHPVGSSITRGGATNGPAAVFALTKFIEWLDKYAPSSARGMTFSEAGPVPAQGNIAQQIFWYTAFTEAMLADDLPVVDDDGLPKWRMAPSPHGPYWEEGMKVGYQDAGSWTLLHHTDPDRRAAAWLFAQFTVAKSTSLAKTHHGLTPIREGDIFHESFTERAPQLGGLVEFYRSPARDLWTDTGLNVPDYPRMSQMWWPNISDAISGERTPQEALDRLALEQDNLMARLERANAQPNFGPRMNPERDPEYWLSQPGSPKPKLDNEKPQGVTVPYEELLRSWTEAQ
ncbi:glycerol transport system substrate-binding protein [Natronocella acetinitrilica]|uniref:Glycerol transport system substrate-binding protein n=1 Tax=Natronocella acetinitrilica TaxID=414046 RepID=A0AAE3KB22_9GAMM|nr:ABC transporter substrate-binding protein [Natronocella acetinitrilica]MCP1673083.1 glycerol transport system substrate-binding protein [Natronocella acetinitrilica]